MSPSNSLVLYSPDSHHTVSSLTTECIGLTAAVYDLINQIYDAPSAFYLLSTPITTLTTTLQTLQKLLTKAHSANVLHKISYGTTDLIVKHLRKCRKDIDAFNALVNGVCDVMLNGKDRYVIVRNRRRWERCVNDDVLDGIRWGARKVRKGLEVGIEDLKA